MDARSAPLLLGLAALFLGGVVGGVLGSALIARTATQPVSAEATPGGGSVDLDLARAIEDLALEVRHLRNAPAEPERDSRRPAGETPAEPGLDEERIVEALDRLTLALRAAQGRASPGGIGITPLVLPAPGSRVGALGDLIGRDWEEISGEYRFWTFQQVLDRFGRPDEVSDNRWIYFVPKGDDQEVFTFQFSQGYLMNIYN